jgi:vancomycin resistance protein YoaR
MNTLWRAIKLQRRCWLRRWADWRSGHHRLMATTVSTAEHDWPHQITISQPIRPGATFANKWANIDLASQKIDKICLDSGQILSFWAVVGHPSLARGFRMSRNLVRGQVSQAVGGGLCQVSGILYHLSLVAGLEVVERHAHSLDIYREEERFSPLGADATVVFGYRDLRVRNPYDFAVQWRLEVEAERITARLCSPYPIEARHLEFWREVETDTTREVTTRWRTPSGTQVLARSRYGVKGSDEL